MFKRNILAASVSAIILAGCGGGGGGSDTAASNGGGNSNGGGSNTTPITAGTELVPAQVNMISATSATPTGFRAVSSRVRSALTRATATDFDATQTNVHTHHESFEQVKQINNILCFVEQFKAEDYLNTGAYTALVDNKACDAKSGISDSGSQSANKASAAAQQNTPEYVEVVVNATTDADGGHVDFWVEKMPGGGEGGGASAKAIRAHIDVTAQPSDDHPMGQFHLYYGMFASMAAQDPAMTGELYSVTTADGDTLEMFEQGSRQQQVPTGQGPITATFNMTNRVALRQNKALDTGAAESQQSVTATFINPNNNQTTPVPPQILEQHGMGPAVWGIRYNPSVAQVNRAQSEADIDADSAEKQCLSRTEHHDTVFRYALFSDADGSRVVQNSGFPIRYKSEGSQDFDKRGYVGYWGVWAEENDHEFADLEKVQREHFGSNQNQAPELFTVHASPGRLVKNSVKVRSLDSLEGVKFHCDMDGVCEYLSNQTPAGFYKTATVQYSENSPPVETALATPVAMVLQEYQQEFVFYSEQLGGEVHYKPGESNILYYVQETVSPADLDADLNLLCFESCPAANVTPQMLEPQNSGELYPQMMDFTTDSAHPTLTPVAYTYSKSVGALQRDGQNVTFTSEVGPQVGPANNGLHTGLMVKADNAEVLALLQEGKVVGDGGQDLFDKLGILHDGTTITEFYRWDTGFEQWNKSVFLTKDADDSVVKFDPPLQFNYTYNHASDERNATDTDSAAYDGQTFLLNYGGFGELNGIPWIDPHFDDGADHDGGEGHFKGMQMLPAINLKDGLVLTPIDASKGAMKVKALDVQQNFIVGDISDCTAVASSNLPSLPADFSGDIAAKLPANVVPVADKVGAVGGEK